MIIIIDWSKNRFVDTANLYKLINILKTEILCTTNFNYKNVILLPIKEIHNEI